MASSEQGFGQPPTMPAAKPAGEVNQKLLSHHISEWVTTSKNTAHLEEPFHLENISPVDHMYLLHVKSEEAPR